MSKEEFHARYSSFIRAYLDARTEPAHLLEPEELARPVRAWVTPSDRQFPHVLLEHPLSALLSLSAYDLVSLRGVGITRATSVLKMLRAIPRRRSASRRYILSYPAAAPAPPLRPFEPETGCFEPQTPSEGQWWGDTCEVVKRHKLEPEPLGRFCESLAHLPRPLWDRPLGAFCQLTFSELQHEWGLGKYKLRLITQVFHTLNVILREVAPHQFLTIRFTHAGFVEVERWAGEALRSNNLPDLAELREKVIDPLLAQVGKDGGDDLKAFAFGRVVHAKSLGVQAAEVGLTREGVRQRLRKVGRIMRVRWREGQPLLQDLLEKVSATPAASAQVVLLRNILQLCYPNGSQYT